MFDGIQCEIKGILEMNLVLKQIRNSKKAAGFLPQRLF